MSAAFDFLLPPFVLLAVGRLVLSLLPAGRPGGHGWHRLAWTLATSHLLGLGTVRLFQGSWVFGTLEGGAALGWLLAACLAVLLVRLGTLPGKMVPSHELPFERRGPWGSGLWTVAVVAAVAVPLLAGGGGRTSLSLSAPAASLFDDFAASIVTQTASVLAALVFTERALAGARRAPLGRVIAVTVLVLPALLRTASGPDSFHVHSAMCAAGVLAFAIPWYRRADPRAAVLVVLAFLTWMLVAASAAPACLVGFVALVLFTPGAARKSVIRYAAIGAIVALVVDPDVVLSLKYLGLHRGPLARMGAALAHPVPGLQLLVVLAALAATLRAPRAGRPPWARTEDEDRAAALRVDPPGRGEVGFAWTLLVVGVLGSVFVQYGWAHADYPTDPSSPPTVAPLVAVVAGLVLLPSEKPGRRV